MTQLRPHVPRLLQDNLIGQPRVAGGEFPRCHDDDVHAAASQLLAQALGLGLDGGEEAAVDAADGGGHFAEAGGHHDDAAAGSADEGEHDLGHSGGAEEVDFGGFFNDLGEKT